MTPARTIIPSVEVVVAHYNEDLSWIKPIEEYCTIYSKGGPANAPKQEHTVLRNIGRESHTFLHHIITHYDDLADIEVFLQGHIDDYISLSPQQILERSLETEEGRVTTFPHRDLERFDLWDGIKWEEYPCWGKWAAMNERLFPLTPGEMFTEYLGFDRVPEAVAYPPGAAFALHRSVIHRHPKAFYQRLQSDCFEGIMAHVHPRTGSLMERFWLSIFRPEEYVLWPEDVIGKEVRNAQGQLTKGHWHVVPKGVPVDHYLAEREASCKMGAKLAGVNGGKAVVVDMNSKIDAAADAGDEE